MKSGKLNIFFRDEMYSKAQVGYSRSPEKPKLVVEKLKQLLPADSFVIKDDFQPFVEEDFLYGHFEPYVREFFRGEEPRASSNGLRWSKEFAETVKYTNSSLYNAIKHSIENPEDLCLSPTSGFHHATPHGGQGFCTFSGQVIASRKLYEEKGLVGAYIDLDGHFGNSIEDSRDYFPDLDKAIKYNINPRGNHHWYLKDLRDELEKLSNSVKRGEVDYIVFCHGADSHEWDDLGNQLNTYEWVQAGNYVSRLIGELEQSLGRKIPTTMALFGGYRKDDYDSVISLHITSITGMCEGILNNDITQIQPEVKPRVQYI